MANRPARAGAHAAGQQHAVGQQHGPDATAVRGVAWLPYLIVLAGVAAGLFVAWQGSRYAGRGAALVGGALLAAAAARLVLPPRFAGLLASRGKALDVAAFAVLGTAVLAVAAWLP
jgi:Protein of unknown function (DUF3017)